MITVRGANLQMPNALAIKVLFRRPKNGLFRKLPYLIGKFLGLPLSVQNIPRRCFSPFHDFTSLLVLAIIIRGFAVRSIFSYLWSKMFFTAELRYITPDSRTSFLSSSFNAFHKTSPLPSLPLANSLSGSMTDPQRNGKRKKFCWLSRTSENSQRYRHCEHWDGNGRCYRAKVNYIMFIMLISYRLPQLEQQFQQLLNAEAAMANSFTSR